MNYRGNKYVGYFENVQAVTYKYQNLTNFKKCTSSTRLLLYYKLATTYIFLFGISC